MEVESVFVTGANRGIGLEFVRQLANLPKPPRLIFATYRNSNAIEELEQLRDNTETSKIILIKMDVTNLSDVQEAKKVVEESVGDEGLNLLINNAGAMEMEPFPNLTEENLLFHFKTNTIGPILLLQELYPLLLKSAERPGVGPEKSISRAAVLNISSLAGSITRAGVNSILKYPVHGYRISKAALNMAMRTLSADLDGKGILVVMMCPGWVKTDLGGKDMAELEIDESVSIILNTLPKLNDSHQGSFISRNGETYQF